MFEYDPDFARFLNKWVPRFLWLPFIFGFIAGLLENPSGADNVFMRFFEALFYGLGCWFFVGLFFVPIQMHYWALSEMRTDRTILGKIVTYILAFVVLIFLFIMGALSLGGSEY